MWRISNGLIGSLNFLVLLLTGPFISVGIWMGKNPPTMRSLDIVMICIGIFLMVVSFAGIMGPCFRISWILRLDLIVKTILIGLLLCVTVFAFLITSKEHKERQEHFSNWLQNSVSNKENWSRFKSNLIQSNMCTDPKKYVADSFDMFYMKNRVALQSSCCKPSDDCGFSYVSGTNWTKIPGPYTNDNCNLWDNKTHILCFDCQPCKTALLDNLRHSWRKAAKLNTFILLILIIVYLLGFCAFTNNRREADNELEP